MALSASNRPVAIDLFAGAGGLSLGLEMAGFDVVAAVEYDPVHAAVHEYNFPATEVLCADVSAPLSADDLLAAAAGGVRRHADGATEWNGEIDLIAGGPPCQGFSLIGKRLVDDKRNQLVFHFYRLVSEIRPKYFIMENVPGMARGGHAGILEQLVSEFEDAGYVFPDEHKYRILNAAEFGAPQERHRLFLIGSRADQPALAVHPSPTVTPVPKRASAGPAVAENGRPLGPTVDDAIGDLPNASRYKTLDDADEVILSAEEIAAADAKASSYARRMRGVERASDDFSYPREWNRSALTASTRTKHTAVSVARFKATRNGETEPISRFYKLDPAGLCNTLRAGSGSERGAFTSPRPLHPTYPRVLTNREAARLHAFPDWFRPHTTKWHGFRQIGNAVVPLVGQAVGAEVIRALGAKPVAPNRRIALGNEDRLRMTMTGAQAHFAVDDEHIPAKRQRGATSSAAAA